MERRGQLSQDSVISGFVLAFVILSGAGSDAGRPVARRQDTAALERASAAIREADRALRTKTAEEAKRYTPEYERQHTAALQQALTRYISGVLQAQPEISADALRDRIASVYNPWSGWGADANTPQAWRLTIGQRAFVVTALLLFRGGEGIPRSAGFIQAFDNSGRPIADAGSEFDGHSLVARQLTPTEKEARFLVNGKRFGDTGSRSDIVLYGFDGAKFNVTWSRPDVPGLVLDVQNGTVRLRYSLKKIPEPPAKGPIVEEYVEELRVTPKGLEPTKGPVRVG